MKIIIREAEPKDYSTIGNLIKNELGQDQLDYDKLYVRLEKMRADENHLTVVAEVDGLIVGFMGLYKGIAYNYDGECIQIIALAVLKEKQNEGIGSQLLKWAEDYAIQHDIRSFHLNSGLHRKEAHAFYEHNGYTKKSYSFVKDI